MIYSQNKNGQQPCSRRQIIAYLDGDLQPREEVDLEKHLAGCKSCVAELNDQKKLLCALEFVLEDPEKGFNVPNDFAKVVVTSAESNVRGLRQPKERFRALFVCLVLILLVLAGLGKETESFVSSAEGFSGQSWAIGSYALQFFHDFGVGVAVVLRGLGKHFMFNSAISLGILLVFFALTSFVVKRLLFKQYGA